MTLMANFFVLLRVVYYFILLEILKLKKYRFYYLLLVEQLLFTNKYKYRSNILATIKATYF